jgi:hypothetical protein
MSEPKAGPSKEDLNEVIIDLNSSDRNSNKVSDSFSLARRVRLLEQKRGERLAWSLDGSA